MVGGLDLGDGAMLVAVTEKRTKEELDAFRGGGCECWIT